MVDFLNSVQTDGGFEEPQPVTLVSNGAEVSLAGLANLTGSTFGPSTFTFTGPNQQFVFPCAGSASAIFQMADNFTGTISSFNSSDLNTATVNPARLYQSGVGSLGRSTIAGQGAAHTGQYRVVTGGSLYILRTSADFVGTATGAVFATDASPLVLTGGSVHTSDEEALRAGRAYSVTTNTGTVASGNSIVIYVSNPAGSGQRIMIPHRLFTSTRTDCVFAGVSNPTRFDLLPTAATAGNRGLGSASILAAKSGVLSAANLATFIASGTAAAGNVCAGGQLDLVFERTLEPGQAFANYLTNPSTGVAAADMVGCITFAFYQEPI